MKKIVLQLKSLWKTYPGNNEPAVKKFNLDLFNDEILSLVGPSGCGKTTLLRLIAGFEELDRGQIRLNEDPISQPELHVPPEHRDIGMVFQDLALFPHLTVLENIGFGLKTSEPNREEKIEEVLELVDMEKHRNRYPEELSGGQQQRVALARSLVTTPRVLLLDEPFSNLDKQLRQRMRREVKDILKEAETPSIFVTHDQEEAMFLGDRMAVMQEGVLEQVEVPEEVVINPQTRFVADFLGPTDFLPARRKGDEILTEIGSLPVREVQLPAEESDEMDLVLRADDVEVSPGDADNYEGTVREAEFKGKFFHYLVELKSGAKIHCLSDHSKRLKPGDKVNLTINPGHTLILFPRREE